MYCKKCGKGIADNSKFCQYCGETLSSVSTIKFNSHKLSKLDWTIIMLGIWWIAFWIAESCEEYSSKIASAYQFYYSDKEFFFEIKDCALSNSISYFIHNAIIPLIVVVIMYIIAPTCYKKVHIYIKKYKDWKETHRKNKATNEIVCEEITNQEHPILEKKQQDIVQKKNIIKTTPLMDFVREYGNMQVAVKNNADGTHETRCIFTNEAGVETIVDFATSLGILTAKQISEQKFALCVYLYSDYHYELDML